MLIQLLKEVWTTTEQFGVLAVPMFIVLNRVVIPNGNPTRRLRSIICLVIVRKIIAWMFPTRGMIDFV